jgi:recombinational DNA repair protein (RecF pathway)
MFCASEWQFTQRTEDTELFQLQEARAIKSHEGLREQFGRMAMAGLLNELMLRVAPEREACLDLFRLHANALAALEELEAEPPPIAFLNGYLSKLLQWSGNQPQLQQCLVCAKSLQLLWQEAAHSERLTMVIPNAGWICGSCRGASLLHVRERGSQSHLDSIQVSASAMADFFMSLVTPIRQVAATAHASDQDHRELFRALEALFIYHLPGFDRLPLNSLKFLGLESSWQPPQDPVR